ncbi:Gfo/Idh/MocA family protein [Edaphobacter modestus]|uniref:Putative dehydrogenase n=1 Tax=Edaphobacter modestus TaxID=388466 RepID=A0A4Q7YYP5_9BACT|nr:Gfo/Idh/MocA family oxidoreductase [Edaphobacter modestus]RZU42920.1 putative dehydrogenase [Edaphobacter modestus]
MRKIGIIMNGVTGRMGTNQHLGRSIVAIRKQGGLRLRDQTTVMPEPVLLGRNEEKLQALAGAWGVDRWSTNLDACLADRENIIYFDAQLTQVRAESVHAALKAQKHVYCEKPLAATLQESLELAREAKKAGVKNGVVQDKLFLPGILKLKQVLASGLLGKVLSVRGEFGYWVFEGPVPPAQRPSWNYRKEEGGGIILDMFPHWQYVLANLFGQVKAVSCTARTTIPQRVDEAGKTYICTADDAAYATFELEGGAIAHINSSWVTRVNRDELLELHVDGTNGSAVAGLRECKVQPRVATPKAVWNPDIPNPIHFLDSWQTIPATITEENAFKVQWEMFLRHVLEDAPFPHTFLEAAKGVQLAEAGMRSWSERLWIDLPELALD